MGPKQSALGVNIPPFPDGAAVCVSVPAPLEITLIDKERVRQYWEFVERGAQTIIRKISPTPDWQCPDLFNALAMGSATLWVAHRGKRKLGFFVGYPQQRPFSRKHEWFLWCAYLLPLRERQSGDGFREVIKRAREIWLGQAQACGGDRVVMLSSRDGFDMGPHSWKRGHTAWYIDNVQQ